MRRQLKGGLETHTTEKVTYEKGQDELFVKYIPNKTTQRMNMTTVLPFSFISSPNLTV